MCYVRSSVNGKLKEGIHENESMLLNESFSNTGKENTCERRESQNQINALL